MRRTAAGLLMLFFIAGCESIPFQKTPDSSFHNVSPAAVRNQFKADIPSNLRLLNAVVFEYNWKKFSGLGFVDVDTAAKTVDLVCINQIGVKLFELSLDAEGIKTHFILPEFTSRGNFTKIVGEDIRRIYFDLVPSENSEPDKKKFSLIFRQQEGEGTMEYVFSGPDRYLTEKTYYENGAPVWRVSFYEYQSKNGRIYPGGTVLKNYKYGYRLIVRLKEISE